MNMHNIETFLAVADSGSFTAAARRLNKTQSAISQGVRQLEDELGVVLINRTGRQITLTPAGDLLRGKASQLVEDMKAMTSMVRGHSLTKIAQLRIGMVDSFTTVLGAALIHCMLNEAQNVSIWSDVTPRLGEALLGRHADIVMTNDPFLDHGQINRHELLREPFVLLLPAEAAWAQGQPDLAALARIHPMIRYGGVSAAATQIEAQCHRLGIASLRRITVDASSKLVAAVAAGVGWGIGTPMWLMRTPDFKHRVQVLPLPGETCYRHLYQLSRRGEHDELALRLAKISTASLRELVDGELRQLLPTLHSLITLPMLVAADAGNSLESLGRRVSNQFA
jgi:DNA-binding transcriptional LysR family regulator